MVVQTTHTQIHLETAAHAICTTAQSALIHKDAATTLIYGVPTSSRMGVLVIATIEVLILSGTWVCIKIRW